MHNPKQMFETMKAVFEKIRKERIRQHNKWGKQDHDNFIWLSILTEEVGELSEAVLHENFGGKKSDKVEKELIHVAAVATQWLEILHDNESKNPIANLTVEMCMHCPFATTHQGKGYCVKAARVIEDDYSVPAWCPLRSGKAIVRLHANAFDNSK